MLCISFPGCVLRKRIKRCFLVCAIGTMSGCTQVNVPPAPNDASDDTSKVPFTDPLSMPATPTLSTDDFNSSATCAGCHPTHFAEWSTSMHSYATVDPVWRALVNIRQADFDGERDRFCAQCHSAIGTRSGEFDPNFSFDNLKPITLEGITCEACHKVVGLERTYNSGHVLDPNAAIHGPIADPAPNGAHESQFSPLHDTSDFCGGCHDVIEQNGLNLERPYEEWTTSPAATAGRNCQTCHMPTYTGRAAIFANVPERDNLHSHRFIGVDMPLTDDYITDANLREEIRGEIRALLRTAGSIKVEAATSVTAGEQLDLFVTVQNLIDAHSLPTGATFNRQLWIALVATDADGNILYQTGHLDDNGDLRDHFSALDPYGDSDLIRFDSGFIDAEGNPTVFPWKAAENISHSLSPLHTRTVTLFVPTNTNTRGPISVEAELRFRTFPPFLIRALGLDELVAKIEIVNIDETSILVEVN